ncbi:hypothetical protein HYH03_016995 [Edaphochlamys debaryana]|uniref:Galactose oxidase n=1 Tax=Edaphochlamys debaryana TaxID=47281 RepID=A0A836BR17_9CHLO|nr:hypothetical protein HYH03_016995 [Edaphochlamys debaryana]|eukprot:KAG2484183.1 hypothetical protein HYH03_016995 [Edaphochlamys debaryana]
MLVLVCALASGALARRELLQGNSNKKPPPSPPPAPPGPPGPPQSPPYNASADDQPDNGQRTEEGVRFPLDPPKGQPQFYGEWELRAVGNVVAIHLSHVPGTDKYFFMERPSGRHPDGGNSLAGYYDNAVNKFTNIYYSDNIFCAGQTVTQDGHVFVVGGHIPKAGFGDGLKGVRIFSRRQLNFKRIANMTHPRWYPTTTLLPDGRITIMGGSVLPGSGTGKNPFYEIWDPRDPTNLSQLPQSPGLIAKTNDIYYPNNYVLPTGHLLVFCNRYGEVMDPYTGEVKSTLPSWSGVAKGVFTEYPFTGTSTLMGLYPHKNYKVELVYFGGQFSYAWINSTASRLALRIGIDFDPISGNFTYGTNWTAEKMPSSRVMGDVTILPNGQMVVLNGAFKGLAGDSASGGVAKANEPNLWPVLYNPEAPYGSRFRVMAKTLIPRMYHSSACLTTDGAVIVAGCDRCDRYWWTTPGGISKSPTSFAEYRIEVFRPPFWFNHTAKPTIEWLDPELWDSYDNVTVIQYGQPFKVRYSMANANESVTSAVLVAPSGTTHSTNMNQRLVGLEIQSQNATSRELVLVAPPNGNIAPPQWYMLFLLNGDFYGKAKWVRLPGDAPRLDDFLATVPLPSKAK